jgi:hypothetical protein
MDMTLQLSRTYKGQDEIFNNGHTVRPRCRQILFAIGDGITLGALRAKLPLTELETLLHDLLCGGFIEARNNGAPVMPAATPAAPAPAAARPAPSLQNDDVAGARDHVLQVLSALAGTKSPAYRKMSEVTDLEGFSEALAMCRKVVAAVASPHQAAEMETLALRRLGH